MLLLDRCVGMHPFVEMSVTYNIHVNHSTHLSTKFSVALSGTSDVTNGRSSMMKPLKPIDGASSCSRAIILQIQAKKQSSFSGQKGSNFTTFDFSSVTWSQPNWSCFPADDQTEGKKLQLLQKWSCVVQGRSPTVKILSVCNVWGSDFSHCKGFGGIY